MNESGKVALYLCGGTGCNIGAGFIGMRDDTAAGFASIKPYFIDTSRSNLSDKISEEDILIIKGTTQRDGSGMKRDENYIPIREAIKDVLLKHRPLDINIVVFSLAGGTGSIAGPLVVRELLDRGLPVIAVAIGSTDSVIAATNTLDTLESLDGAANSLGKVLPIFYVANTPEMTQSEVDQRCAMTIAQITLLAGRQIKGVDVSDVYNFLNYNRVTQVRPGVASFDVYTSDSELLEGCRPVSMISIYENKDSPRINARPDYLVTGFLDINLNGSKQAHFVIDVESPGKWHKDAKAVADSMEEASAARPKQARMEASGAVDDIGMKFR